MKIKYFLICFFLFWGCRSLNEVQFIPLEKGYKRLPSLKHEYSIEYSRISLNKLQEKELKNYIEDELFSNAIKPGENVGRIVLNAELSMSFDLYGTVMTGFTFGIWNLLGLPFAPYKSNLVISATIIDSNNKILEKYKSFGSGKAIVALYWGYSMQDAIRKSYLMAAKEALEGLEKKVQQDYASLSSRLGGTNQSVTVTNNIASFDNIENYPNSDVDSNIPNIGVTHENRYALIIGNEDYSSFQTGLTKEVNVTYAKKDALIFKEYAIKLLGVPSENVLFKINARIVEMNKLIEQINGVIKNSGGDTEVYVYYAGHGFPDLNTQESYIIPVDCSGTDLKYAIKLEYLYNKLTEFPSKKIVVFMDACFSGGARNAGLLATRGVKIKPKQGLIKGNLIVFAATSAEQSALAYQEKEHGMFTYFLLKKLQETKGEITYSELSDYIQKQVGIKSVIVNALEQNPITFVGSEIENDWKSIKIR